MLKATSAEICKLKVLKNAAIKTQWHALHLFGKVQIEILAYFSNLLHDELRQGSRYFIVELFDNFNLSLPNTYICIYPNYLYPMYYSTLFAHKSNVGFVDKTK